MITMKTEEETKYKIDFKYNLKLYLGLLKNYKGIIAIVLIMVLFIQASHVLDSYLFKLLVDSGTEFSAGGITAPEFGSFLLLLLIIFSIVAIITAILRWWHIHLINILDSSLMLELKEKFFNHLTKLSHSFHTSNKTGSIISRLIRGAGAIERITDVVIFNFVPLLFQSTLVGLTLLLFDTASAIVVFVVIIIFIGYSYYINKKQQSANIKANIAEDAEKAAISDIFTNIDSIKYFGKEAQIQRRYLKLGIKTKTAMVKHWNYFRWLSSGHSIIISLGILAILIFPILRLMDGALTIGSVVFVYTSFYGLLGQLFGFDHGLRNYYRAMADFESLFQYYKVKNEIEDLPNARNLRIHTGQIEFKDVNFKYKNRWIFKDFNLVIPANKKVAFVGPSGSGKSTLIKLIYRLYDVQNGSVLIDSENITQFKQESLRSELSIVPQECVLFDDDITNNIVFSRRGAKPEDVKKAIKQSHLHKVIERLSEKEKTIVGERGVKLSGGEKQRVSIARAILADKKVLVLDEATSSLDSETEHEIQLALSKLMKGRTAIIIAHRLSTIMHADIIVVMDKGKIVQKGKHNDLIKQDGLYKKLWNLQKGGYIK